MFYSLVTANHNQKAVALGTPELGGLGAACGFLHGFPLRTCSMLGAPV